MLMTQRWARLSFVLGSLACALAFVPTAGARPRGGVRSALQEVNLRPPLGMRSRSFSFPWEGNLRNALKLESSEYVRHVNEYAAAGHFYGTWELVQLIERAARRVAFRLPGPRLSVGELSRATGGAIPGHHSHENGRDVDIGFYMTLADGRPYHGFAFADFGANGVGTGPNHMLRFDDARNWELVAKLISDSDARVQYIFVSEAIQQRLIAEAKRRGIAPGLLARAKTVMAQPTEGHPHRNHFHVRIYCAPADRPSCKDRAPYYPWYPGVPPGGMYAAMRQPL
jgi:penicillin-insensitive murein endopeptidase